MRLPEAIIITGANGQTPVKLAAALAAQGCRLILTAHERTDRIEALAGQYPELCKVLTCDLTNLEQTEKVINETMIDTGWKVQGLVHAAAIRSYDAKPLTESEPAIWNHIFQGNIAMAYNVLRVTLPYFVQQQHGKVVMFGSSVTRTGLHNGSAYAAAKSALANLVKSLAWENAEHNIQINMISPAAIDTVLEEDYSGNYLKFRQDYFAAYKKTHPAHKLISPDDIIKTIMPMLDLENTSLSGEEILLTGGVLWRPASN